MFLSKDTREARKKQRTQIKKLESHIEQLEHQLDKRQKDVAVRIEAYKQSVADRWEYLEVYNVNVDYLNQLGAIGWELVGVTSYAVGAEYKEVQVLFLLKRMIPEIPKSIFSDFEDIPEIESRIREAKRVLNDLGSR